MEVSTNVGSLCAKLVLELNYANRGEEKWIYLRCAMEVEPTRLASRLKARERRDSFSEMVNTQGFVLEPGKL